MKTSSLSGSRNITVILKHPYEATFLLKTSVREHDLQVIRDMKWNYNWVRLLKNTHEVLR